MLSWKRLGRNGVNIKGDKKTFASHSKGFWKIFSMSVITFQVIYTFRQALEKE